MNDPIEDALRQMKPADLPPALMARLTAARPQGADSAEAETSPAWPLPAPGGVLVWLRRWLLPLGVSAVAAIGTVTWLNYQHSGALPPAKLITVNTTSPAPLPFERENRLVNAREVGVVVGPDQRPFRLMEVEWTESETVRPRAGGDAVRVETTRRGVLPVAIEIY